MGQGNFKQKAVWGLNESGVNSKHWYDAMSAESRYSAGDISTEPSTASGCQPGVIPSKQVCSPQEYHSSCRRLISRKLPQNQCLSAAEAWHTISLQSLAPSWRLDQASSLPDWFLHLQSPEGPNS